MYRCDTVCDVWYLLQVWYMCEVCKCPLNTPEQFRLHTNSPRHNTEVEKSRKKDNSNRSSPIDTPPPQSSGQLPPLPPLPPPPQAATGTDPSDFQHLVLTRSSVKTTPGAYVPQPQQSPDTAGLVRMELGALGALKTEPGSPGAMMGGEPGVHSAALSYTGQVTSAGYAVKTEPGGNSSAFVTATSGYPSENGFTQAGGGGGNPTTYPGSTMQRDRNASSSQASLPGRAVTNNNGSQENHHHAPGGSDSSIQQQDSFSSGFSSQGQGHSGHRMGAGTFSEVSHGLAVQQICRGSAGSRGSRSIAQMLRPDGNYEFDDDDTGRRLPTSSSSANYRDQDGPLRGQEEADPGSSLAVSAVHSGYDLSLTDSEKKLAESMAGTNNLTSIHTDPGSLSLVAGLEGLRLGSSVMPDRPQQPRPSQGPEANPFKGFRYSCNLCKQPMNTKEGIVHFYVSLKEFFIFCLFPRFFLKMCACLSFLVLS